MGAQFCGYCGVQLDADSHQPCLQALSMEPPRYCSHCARRMKVQVLPAGWIGRCSVHGEVSHG